MIPLIGEMYHRIFRTIILGPRRSDQNAAELLNSRREEAQILRVDIPRQHLQKLEGTSLGGRIKIRR